MTAHTLAQAYADAAARLARVICALPGREGETARGLRRVRQGGKGGALVLDPLELGGDTVTERSEPGLCGQLLGIEFRHGRRVPCKIWPCKCR